MRGTPTVGSVISGAVIVYRVDVIGKISQYLDSDTSDHLYNKVPLLREQNSFRLLSLEQGRWSQPISFTLHEAPLEKAPLYTALSYAWINTDSAKGDAEKPKRTFERVQCNGATMEISTNLWAALRRLRNTKAGANLWVDAVCINQKDHQERNHQVGMMRKIYEKATLVIIWLGEMAANDDWGEALLPTLNLDQLTKWFGDKRYKPKWEAFVERQERRVRQKELNVLSRDIFGAFCILWLLSVGVEASNINHLRHIAESVTIVNGLQAFMEQSWVCAYHPR